MKLARLIAVALLAYALSGCQSMKDAMKDDPIFGDNPWQPGQPFPKRN